MRLQLTGRWPQHLRALPEQGIGYQRVDVTLRSGQRVRDVIVFNAQEAQWPDERAPIEIADIAEIEVADAGRGATTDNENAGRTEAEGWHMNGEHETHFDPDGPYGHWYCNIDRVPHRQSDEAPYHRTNNPEAVTCGRCLEQMRRHPE